MKTIALLLFLFSFIGCAYFDAGGVGYDRGKTKVFKGKACSTIWFGFFPVGRADLNAAKKNGGLRRIAYYDKKITNYYLWVVNCTIAYGERSKKATENIKKKKRDYNININLHQFNEQEEQYEDD